MGDGSWRERPVTVGWLQGGSFQHAAARGRAWRLGNERGNGWLPGQGERGM